MKQNKSNDGREIYRLRDILTNCDIQSLFGIQFKQTVKKKELLETCEQ